MQTNLVTSSCRADHRRSFFQGMCFRPRWNRDFRQQTVNLSLGSSWGWDAIAPVLDDNTQTGDARKTTLHWNAEQSSMTRCMPR